MLPAGFAVIASQFGYEDSTVGVPTLTAPASLDIRLKPDTAPYIERTLSGEFDGIDDLGLQHKIKVIEQALAINRPDASDALDVLQKVGGLEIAGLAGVMIAAASKRIPVVVDGFISTAAAMIAAGLAPGTRNYLISAHQSVEVGHRAMLSHLGLSPLLDLNLRLGEGTGAALAFHLIEASTRILREMATFGEAGVSDKE